MRLFIALAAAAIAVVFCSEPVPLPQGNAYKNGSAIVIPLNETGTNDLFEKWMSQAVSGLFAAIAQKHLHSVEESEKEKLHNCSKTAGNVPDHARCVSRLLKVADGDVVKDKPETHLKHKIQKSSEKVIGGDEEEDLKWVGGFGQSRAKRDANGYKVVSRSSYILPHSHDETPFSQVAKYLTNTVRALKNKNETETWRETLIKVKKTAEEEKALEEAKTAMKKKLKSFIDNTPTRLEDPIKMTALQELEKEEADRKAAMSKKESMSEEIRVPMKLMRDAIKLGMEMGGHDVAGFENKTLKFLSPRFFSVVEEEAEEDMINLLSPSIFSLHDGGSSAEKLSSLPKLLKGLSKKDQEHWMNFIIEASGVNDAVNQASNARKMEKQKAMTSEDGAPLYFTKKNLTQYGDHETEKVDLFEGVQKTFDDKQKSDLDKHGFSFYSEEQLEMMYGEKSPYHQPEKLAKYKAFAMLNEEQKMATIKNEIHDLSTMDKNALQVAPDTDVHRRRQKRLAFSPFMFTWIVGPAFSKALSNTWIVCSPLVFSPIVLAPAAVGPIILSPWVFIPLILSPRVLGPLVLSPMIFSPIVLSPLALHPLILSPGIFNPFVLSPFVLSPFILSPQVFTPLILSPFALSPLILTPMVGSPLILSPFVLSPIICSPQLLFAVVLSPYALSPLVESKLTAAEVVLSPSWLS